MKKTFLLLTLLLVTLTAGAQWTTRNVVYTTGGNYGASGNFVRTYTYDPLTQNIVQIDSALGDFTNAVLSENQYIFSHVGRGSLNPAGSDVVNKYSYLTQGRVDSAPNVSGLQRMMIHNNYLIATFGFGATSGFVRIFNKNSLSIGPIFTDTNIPVVTDGLAVVRDTLYVSYTLNDTAHLGVFSLTGTSPAYVTSVVLDSLSAGLGELFSSGNFIYGLSEYTDWSTSPPTIISAGVLRYNVQNGTFSFAPTPRAYKGIGLLGTSLYANFSTGPGLFDLSGNTLISNPAFTLDYAGARVDTLSTNGYFMTTDYFSTGKMYIVDQGGAFLDSFNTDISGGPIAFQYNGLPIAVDGTGNTPVNTPFTYNMLLIAGDADGAPVTFSIDQAPLNGSASFANNILTYTPNNGFVGMDEFRYLVTDIWGDTVSARFTVNVGATAVDGDIESAGIRVYPNPSRESVQVYFEGPAREVIIRDLQGRTLIAQWVEANAPISLDTLAPGVYLVSISGSNRAVRLIRN